MNKKTSYIILLLGILLVFNGCSNLKYLPAGQSLYTGAEIKLNPDSSKKVKNNKTLLAELTNKTRPKPNAKILGLRYKLWFYNIAGKPKGKGLRFLLRNKLGEPPVLMSQLKLQTNNDVLSSYLLTQGYLQAKVTGDTIIKDKKGKAVYTAITGQQYKINNISLPKDTNGVAQLIRDNAAQSLLKKGDPYNLDTYKNERNRIDNLLKEKGYFYFNPDFLLMEVDSTIGNHLVDVFVTIKKTTPDQALKPYTINDIRVYPNYTLEQDSTLRRSGGIVYKDFEIIDPKQTYKPKVFERMIFFNKGENYNRTDHNLSLNRLVNLGTFKFVKAELTPVDSARSGQLNTSFFLTPLKKNSLSAILQGTSKSNNFVGSEVRVNQTNRNVFRGAEQLTIGAAIGFEQQVSGQSSGIGSTSLTTDATLTWPRFVTPFFEPKITSAFVPKTKAVIGYQLLSRTEFYKLNSIKGEFGYSWKENARKEHNLNPISITYVQPSQITPKFDSLLFVDPTLRNNFQEQFIIGSNYNFTYSNQLEQQRRNNYYFKGSVEVAGNILGAIVPKDEDGQKRLLKTPFSQYAKLELDLRDYFKITPGLTLASRLIGGYGLAYGNSRTLPFVRQFFAGGSNDIRAFRARAVGPGTYDFRTGQNATGLLSDQPGDIKLEANTELRAKLFSVVNGALFIDAGNVWTRKEDPNKPGSQFRLSNALSELAVGTGAGIRIDATIFVIRLDAAFPIRKPYLPAGQRWVFNEVNFGSKEWRKENLILNIGIGYPF